jgi:hypothetical protein
VFQDISLNIKGLKSLNIAIGGLVVSLLAIGLKVRWFEPGKGRLIFKVDKNTRHDVLRRGSKAVGPMS